MREEKSYEIRLQMSADNAPNKPACIRAYAHLSGLEEIPSEKIFTLFKDAPHMHIGNLPQYQGEIRLIPEEENRLVTLLDSIETRLRKSIES